MGIAEEVGDVTTAFVRAALMQLAAGVSLKDIERQVRFAVILGCLVEHKGNRFWTAKDLKMHRNTLYANMRDLAEHGYPDLSVMAKPKP